MISSKLNTSSPLRADRRFAALLSGASYLTLLLVLLVLAFLVREAAPVLRHSGFGLVSDSNWQPLEGHFGVLYMLLATLAAALGAVVVATPIGLASAIFQRFYATKRIARLHRMVLALLSGIPSVVYGLWGLTVLVPIIAHIRPPGTSLLAAILVLALMILPTVALASASALAAVPEGWLQAAAALGLTRKGEILFVAVPAARAGILGGVLLALARALGETMAVLMVAGNVVQAPFGALESVRVLTANIALEMAYAGGDHRSGLFASGLLLTVLVLLLAWLAARVTEPVQHV